MYLRTFLERGKAGEAVGHRVEECRFWKEFPEFGPGLWQVPRPQPAHARVSRVVINTKPVKAHRAF